MKRSSIRIGAVLAVACAIVAGASILPAAGQYGGLSGLFVTIHPDDPNRADFTGFGCTGGEEVVLYMPAVEPTPDDPGASITVPGRILGVTRAVTSDDPLLDGTFEFLDILLPLDIPRGTYEVHARCGDLDLFVLIELRADGAVVIGPPPPALSFTGRESSRLATYGVLLITAGAILVSGSRRRSGSTRR